MTDKLRALTGMSKGASQPTLTELHVILMITEDVGLLGESSTRVITSGTVTDLLTTSYRLSTERNLWG